MSLKLKGKLIIYKIENGEKIKISEGENTLTNALHFVIGHLCSQFPSTLESAVSKVKAYDPRIAAVNGNGISGTTNLPVGTFNPSAGLLRITYMAFGIGTTPPSPDQYGIESIVDKEGRTETEIQNELQNGDYDISQCFYPISEVKFFADANGVEDRYVQFIARMNQDEGQPAGGGSITYTEVGLFTGKIIDSTYNGMTQKAPIMVARKVEGGFTKTDSTAYEFVWQINF